MLFSAEIWEIGDSHTFKDQDRAEMLLVVILGAFHSTLHTYAIFMPKTVLFYTKKPASKSMSRLSFYTNPKFWWRLQQYFKPLCLGYNLGI